MNENSDAQQLEWTLVDSAVGPLFLAATGTGLVRVEFHGRERMAEALESRLGTPAVRPPAGREVLLAEPIRQLAAYFDGRLRDFRIPLDWRLSAGFNRLCLRELAAGVPYGTVIGYGELAARAGRPGGAQAVGAAMGSNPLPVVVPCHRVVESDGGLGGFGGGAEAKRILLALEGVLPQPLF
ncbi:methylated-DNA--[protein]-cysteine S-methyltransferase [Streptomyces bambusae]|uniref:methylated-DNA--[protein]-cysteine S-methyltransferase n=1 Tax=Streptomyces bambusae TaxID=1550616 RepID=UPI001CFECD91|nr:methylated-DNA--[protein]-cysteine S-methyltransferase [Streptomyces bambusae]MCB5166793.1 methylated-DNA--[protein]-cysteine S-methyltransferase [Streptomyces bambusae]